MKTINFIQKQSVNNQLEKTYLEILKKEYEFEQEVHTIIKKYNESCKQVLLQNEDYQKDKQIWMKLQEDIFDYGLTAEFAEFLLENPEFNIHELDLVFRDEWDI